jgi:hypothetical protein
MAWLEYDENRITIPGLAQNLADLVRRNMRELGDDPELLADLGERLIRPAGRWRYRLDPGPDRWSTFAVLRKRYGDGPIIFDCEDAAGFNLAWLLLRFPDELEARAVVTKPRPDAPIAHAYGVWRWKQRRTQDPTWQVLDICVLHGMPWPGADFYGSGETFKARINWK